MITQDLLFSDIHPETFFDVGFQFFGASQLHSSHLEGKKNNVFRCCSKDQIGLPNINLFKEMAYYLRK